MFDAIPYQAWIFAIFIGFALLEFFSSGFFHKPGQINGDGKVELIGSFVLLAFTQPLTVFMGTSLTGLIAPQTKDILADIPLWSALLLFFIFDDMVQYWWHRLSHSVSWLYNLHRPHHHANYMSVRIVYRNNAFFYLLMPSLWLSGALSFMGLGEVYAGFLIAKLTIIYAAHCDVRWDQPLYKIKALHPIMWVVERVISTPTTHSAHHGKHIADGVTNYHGNFGNMFFIWDVIFGTAKITRKVPEEFGEENLPLISPIEQIVWPLARSENTAVTLNTMKAQTNKAAPK